MNALFQLQTWQKALQLFWWGASIQEILVWEQQSNLTYGSIDRYFRQNLRVASIGTLCFLAPSTVIGYNGFGVYITFDHHFVQVGWKFLIPHSQVRNARWRRTWSSLFFRQMNSAKELLVVSGALDCLPWVAILYSLIFLIFFQDSHCSFAHTAQKNFTTTFCGRIGVVGVLRTSIFNTLSFDI